RENALQLEVDSLTRLPDERAAEARERFEAALDERAEPADVDPAVRGAPERADDPVVRTAHPRHDGEHPLVGGVDTRDDPV
ncbi:hypothetical protein R3751_16700, partial [Halorubrum distributum]|uniref:hypothetical protein n=1 Tax=Halorubrum distributum TaxID=29283 RepID=UPI0029550F4D